MRLIMVKDWILKKTSRGGGGRDEGKKHEAIRANLNAEMTGYGCLESIFRRYFSDIGKFYARKSSWRENAMHPNVT